MDSEPVRLCTPPLDSADEMSCCGLHPLAVDEENSGSAMPGSPRECSSSASDVGPPISNPPAASEPSVPGACSDTMIVLADASTPLEVKPGHCKARTWKRALLPLLPQCTKKPLAGHDFCASHQRHLAYGRCDNPTDPRILAKVAASMKRKTRKSTKRWYCRYFMFKQAQDTWGLQNVEDMSDEQYAQALNAVHEYLYLKPTLRSFWKLQHDKGPEDVSERDTPKAFYCGEPVRYKNYSYRLLC